MIFTDYSSKVLAATLDKLGTDDLLRDILVPVDFSDCSDNAIRFAVAIGLRTGARIKLFHAVQVPLTSNDYGAFPIAEVEKDAAIRLGSKVEEINNWLDKERFRRLGVMHQVHVGFASEEIIRVATHDKSDLIVMGTRGAGAIEGALLGSNAALVVEKAPCPVMVLPEGAEFSGFHKMVYATDMEEVNRPAVKFLVDFAGHFDTELHVLHVVAAGDSLTPEQANAFKDQFSKASHYHKTSYHIVDAEDDTVAHAIEGYTLTHGIEVIATLTHRRGFFGKLFHPSTTKRLAIHASKPLLVLH